MTNLEMLAKVRTFLDESAEDFYFDDEEIYPALSDAQREIVNVIANNWFYQGRPLYAPIPRTLQPLVLDTSGTLALGTNSITVASQVVVPVSLRWNPNGAVVADLKNCVFVTEGEVYMLISNKSLADGYYAWWNNTGVYVNPISANASASYNLKTIKAPVDITASVQPVTDEVAHDAIVERSLWLLLKDRETQQAQIHLQMYGQLLQGLMQ